MSSLLERIQTKVRQALESPQFTGGLKGRIEMRLVPFLGNGVSRMALARAGRNDQSYAEIVNNACRRARLAPLEHLQAHGHGLDSILRLAFEQGGQNLRQEMFRNIWELYNDPEVKPTPLHFALAESGHAFITTNYDCLVERSLKAVQRYASAHCHAQSLAENAPDAFPACSNEDKQVKCVYKIHGSLPILPDSQAHDAPLAEGYFYRWLQEKGIDSLVATADVYDFWAFRATNPTFRAKFAGVLDLLQDTENLILVVGHGLRTEERIIYRLLEASRETVSHQPASVLVLTFDTEADAPQLRLPQRMMRVNIHPGLAGSSLKRELATAVLLEELHQKHHIKLSTTARALVRDAMNTYPEVPGAEGILLPAIEPLVAVAGQVAFHTCRGYEDAPAQERAYSPVLATWRPGDHTGRPLESSRPFGDACVPALVLDALGIPASLAGRIGCDKEGRAIIDDLISHTQFLDFSNVIQETGKPDAEVPRTESATVACWFDLRTILDGPRSFSNRVVVDELAEPRIGGRIVYTSKPALYDVVPQLHKDDLLIFDSGGTCRADELVTALRVKSVIVASAVVLYQFLRASSLSVDGAENGFDANWTAAWTDYRANEPTNETGRYYQLALLIDLLNDPSIHFNLSRMERQLGNAEALAVTLGPLGCIWWERGDWSRANWTRVKPAHNLTPSERLTGQCLPFSEIRNALGCGDSMRAGMAAALAIQERARGVRWGTAFRAAVWTGSTRLMFWDLGDFTSWLRTRSMPLLSAFKTAVAPLPWPDNVSRRIETVTLPDSEATAELISLTDEWRKNILGSREAPRTAQWEAAIREWARSRNVERARGP